MTLRAPVVGHQESAFRVMVVDDESSSRNATCRLLARLGARAIAADGSETALQICEVSGSNLDLILMDIVMPGLDGYETTRRIRAIDGCARVPIIGWSSRSDDHARAMASDAGMNDLVKRRSNDETLSDVLDRWLGDSDR